jgi:hypothetical protein
MVGNKLILIFFLIFSLDCFARLSDSILNVQKPDDTFGVLQSDASGNLTVNDPVLRQIVQDEFDETQIKQDSQLSETQGFRLDYNNQTDETQLKIDDVNTNILDFKSEYTSQTNQTQLILQAEFDETQSKQDSQLSETQGFRLDYNTQTDQTQTILQTEFDQSQAQIDNVTKQINEEINNTTDGIVTNAVMKGKNQDSGLYEPVELSPSNSVKVAISDRPSEIRGRTRVIIPIARASLTGTPTVYYTPTVGSTLYISSFLITALNSSTQDGQFQLRNSTTVYVDFLVPSRVSGSSPSSFSVTAPTLPEPLPFTVDLNFIEITGSVEIAGYLIGYEEPN